MTKNEYMKIHDRVHNTLTKKYGSMLYFLCVDILNLSQMEKVVHNLGYKTIRKKIDYTPYDILYHNDKEIGKLVPCVGFPSIELKKRNKKHARIISKSELVIEPIIGVHRILDWHEVDGKFQILAGGEIVLNFIPVDITIEMAEKFFKDSKISQSMIDEIKSNQPTDEELNEQFKNYTK